MTNSKETASKKIEFIQFDSPAIRAGDYTIEIEQKLKTEQYIHTQYPVFIQPETDKKFPKLSKTFEVIGPRFSLSPEDVYAIFPPKGSLGDHSNVLPHILLNKSTLPWQRTIDGKSETTPWLALLVFREAEKPDMGDPVALQDIKDQHTSAWMPSFDYETGQLPTDKVNIIEIEQEFLQKILPSKNDLEYLAHARQGLDINDHPQGNEKAVIIANRLPQQNEITNVHLVSLENYFGVKIEAGSLIAKLNTAQLPSEIITALSENKVTLSNNKEVSVIERDKKWLIVDEDTKKKYEIWVVELNGQTYLNIGIFRYKEAGNKKIRFVSLKNWSFSCTAHQRSFKGILENLNRAPATPRLKAIGGSTISEPYLSVGMSPHAHFMRRGSQSVSWFHGPLSTGELNLSGLALPVLTADQLIFYFQDVGMFDVSYAAAWELGRLMSLQSKRFSTALYQWKKNHAQLVAEAENRLTQLPKHHNSVELAKDLDLPKVITDWFKKTSLLEGVPFNYLIPEAEMLPIEAIRFFKLDQFWLECLLDGAFSIGRVNASDLAYDIKHCNDGDENFPKNPSKLPFEKVSGFILRSEVVSGWPGLLVDAVEDDLLTMDDRFVSDLNANTLSNEFREAFAINNKKLLPTTAGKIQVVIEDADAGNERWKLLDLEKEEQYIIQHIGSELRVTVMNKLLRKTLLAPDVMLCLYEGDVQTIDFHLKAETLHFGLDFPDATHNGFFKKLKGDDGKQNGEKLDSIPFKNGTTDVIDIVELAMDLKEKLSKAVFTSAQFALEMTEGVERVRFKIID